MTTVVILSIGVAIAVALPIAWRVRQRRFDPFEPIVIFALAWGVMFVVRPIAIVVRDDTNFYGVDIGGTLDKAVLVGLVGAVAFVAGYELRGGRRLAGRLPEPPEIVASHRVLAGAVVVALLGMLSLALVLLPAGVDGVHTFLSGRSAELSDLIEGSTLYLWYGSLMVVPAALVGFAVAMTTRSAGTIAVAFALIGLALLRTVPTGNRIFLLVLLGGIVVFVFVRIERRPGVLALVVGLAAALVLSYAVLGFRTTETRNGLSALIQRLADAPQRVLNPLVRGPDAEMAPALAGGLLVVPERFDYRFGGATVGDLVVRPIPRELWPGKPEVPGRQVTAAVWPGARETGGFDPAFTPAFFFYWDFGSPGVFVGMALLGILARGLYEYLLRRPRSMVAQLVFSAGLWYLVVAVRHDPVSVFVWGIVLFAPLIVILGLGAEGRRERGARRLGSTPSERRGYVRSRS